MSLSSNFLICKTGIKMPSLQIVTMMKWDTIREVHDVQEALIIWQLLLWLLWSSRAGVGQPVLMQKICLKLRTVKFLLGACHLKTGISEKTGPLEICLKNMLENLKVTGVRLQRALNARKISSAYILWAVGSNRKILSKEVIWWNWYFKGLVLMHLIIRCATWIGNETVKSKEWERRGEWTLMGHLWYMF